MDDPNSNESDFLLNSRNLKLTIYVSLVVANLVFAINYPEHAAVGIIGAVFFGLLPLVSRAIAWVTEPKAECENTEQKLKPADRK